MPCRDSAGWAELDLEGLWCQNSGAWSYTAFCVQKVQECYVAWVTPLWIRAAAGPLTPGSLTRHFCPPPGDPSGPEWVLPFPSSSPTTTRKAPEVLTAAERGGSSPEQWKNKLLKGLFPCSEYFYKANPQGLSPHTQLFLRFLTSSPVWAFGDVSGGREVGVAPGFG